ncbi:hypothetical protein ACFE04_003484 [Oxalis oulophora]
MATFIDTNKHRRCRRFRCTKTLMVQQSIPPHRTSSLREQERLSAKESLLLAVKDAGGFKAILTGKTTEIQNIDVTERITSLESLNPTPRPTTSPLLEGRWNFEWFGYRSPGFFAARVILERSPSALANLSDMDLYIKDGNAKITADVKLFNSMVSKITVLSKLTIEGPLRMKEEYSEAILESPKIVEETVPDQLQSVFSQAVNVVEKLPFPIKEGLTSGLKLPLSGLYQRLFMISYLDEEILIIRDATGVPEVHSRLDLPSSTFKEPSE